MSSEIDEGWGSDDGWSDKGDDQGDGGWDDVVCVDEYDELPDEKKGTGEADSLKSPFELFEVFDIEQVKELQRSSISNVSTKLGITSSAAGVLLKHCRWKEDDLFANYEKNSAELCAAANITCSLYSVMKPSDAPSRQMTCEVCFGDVLESGTFSLNCGHRLCLPCWQEFLGCEIETGAVSGGTCLTTSCPGFKCNEVVGAEVFEMLLSHHNNGALIEKYQGVLY